VVVPYHVRAVGLPRWTTGMEPFLGQIAVDRMGSRDVRKFSRGDLKNNKTVSGFSQTQQYISYYFYLDDMFRPTDRHQAIFTILSQMHAVQITLM